jgi:hypothetical protein
MSRSSKRPYQDEYRKNAKTDDILRKPKNMVRETTIEGERKERYKLWIHFWRQNPHRFIEDYFGIHLHPYQILMIWVLQRSNLAYIVASRAAAKTWIIAVWSLTLAVLYPGIKIICCAKTLNQGGILLKEKLTSLRSKYPNVNREIFNITTNSNTYEATFKCGSTIKICPSSESSRGNRANYIIIEESRLVPREILEQVIKPFLEVRSPNFRTKPEYRDNPDYKEEGIISYITSAWYKAEYWYTYVKTCIRRMVSGDDTANFLALDYLICLRHDIKTEEMLRNEMNDADEMTVQMEYYNIPSGSSGSSYYKMSMFPRTVKRAFYPQKLDTYNPKKNPYDIKKVDGEIRIISADIATRANRVSDQTAICAVRLIPLRGRGYKRSLCFLEVHKGKSTILQAKRLKEIFYDFEADWMVIDLQNAGIGVFDALSQVTDSEERGIQFPPMTVADNPFIDLDTRQKLRERTLGLNASPVIFPISATQQLNSQIAISFRNSLQKKMWEFLIPDGDAEDFLMKTNKEFLTVQDDLSMKPFFISPYVNVGLLIGECINLDMSLVNGMIRLVEKPGCFKDRFSSVSYLNWVVSNCFDIDLLRENEDVDDWSVIESLTMFV